MLERTKELFEKSAFLIYYAMYRGNSLPTPIGPILKDQESITIFGGGFLLLGFLALENVTDILSRNVDKELTSHATQWPRRVYFLSTSRRRPKIRQGIVSHN